MERPLSDPRAEAVCGYVEKLAARPDPMAFDANFYALAQHVPPQGFSAVGQAFARALVSDAQAQIDSGTASEEVGALAVDGRLDAIRTSAEQPDSYPAYSETVDKVTFRYREDGMTRNLKQLAAEAAAEQKNVTFVTGQSHVENVAAALEADGFDVVKQNSAAALRMLAAIEAQKSR
jgi:hypothetical protein